MTPDERINSIKELISLTETKRLKTSGDKIILIKPIAQKILLAFLTALITISCVALLELAGREKFLIYLCWGILLIITPLMLGELFKTIELDIKLKIISVKVLGIRIREKRFNEIARFIHTAMRVNGIYVGEKFEIKFKQGIKLYFGNFKNKKDIELFQKLMDVIVV